MGISSRLNSKMMTKTHKCSTSLLSQILTFLVSRENGAITVVTVGCGNRTHPALNIWCLLWVEHAPPPFKSFCVHNFITKFQVVDDM
jgi:hypothetical protein